MSNASFVRRAPEIAEEILAKTANLPKDLKSFTRNLFEKEASDQTESLKLPARMTVEDLRKIAAGNKVDLPKIAAVKPEEYADVAAGLRKIAEVHAQETGDEIFAAAISILEKAAGPGPGAGISLGGAAALPHVVPTATRAGKGFWKSVSSLIPGTQAWKARQRLGARHRLHLAEIAEKTPGEELYKLKKEREIAKEVGERAEKARDVWAGTAKSLGTSAAVGGAGVGAATVLQPKPKKEIRGREVYT